MQKGTKKNGTKSGAAARRPPAEAEENGKSTRTQGRRGRLRHQAGTACEAHALGRGTPSNAKRDRSHQVHRGATALARLEVVNHEDEPRRDDRGGESSSAAATRFLPRAQIPRLHEARGHRSSGGRAELSRAAEEGALQKGHQRAAPEAQCRGSILPGTSVGDGSKTRLHIPTARCGHRVWQRRKSKDLCDVQTRQGSENAQRSTVHGAHPPRGTSSQGLHSTCPEQKGQGLRTAVHERDRAVRDSSLSASQASQSIRDAQSAQRSARTDGGERHPVPHVASLFRSQEGVDAPEVSQVGQGPPGQRGAGGSSGAFALVNKILKGFRPLKHSSRGLKPSWPIHVKKCESTVNMANLNVLAEEGAEQTREEWQSACRYLTDVSAYKEVQLHHGEKPKKCTISAERLKAVMPLLKRQSPGFIPKGFINLFLVPEDEKKRYRLITETVTVNDNTNVPFKLRPATIDEIRAKSLLQGAFAVMFDMASWFYQFVLGDAVQQFVATEFGDAWYTFAYGPMGQKQMCHVAHTGLKILAETAVRRAQVQVALDLFIDNVRAVGSEEAVTRFGQEFLKVCQECEAVVNEPDVEVTQQGEFCGVRFDLITACVGNTEKTKRKLMILKERFDQGPIMGRSVQDFLSDIGVLVFASQVLGLPLHPVYYCIKFLRRVCRKLQDGRIKLTDNLQLWPSLIPIFQEWLRVLVASNNVSVVPPQQHAVLVTDATLQAWGYVLFVGGQIFHGGHYFAGADAFGSINELELRAVRLSLNESIVAIAVKNKLLYVVIDNTSAEACIRKRRSARFFLNREVTFLEQRLDELNVAIASTHYIRSAQNPADAKSRFEALDLLITNQLRRAVAKVCSAATETNVNSPQLCVSHKLSSERFADVETMLADAQK